MIGSAARLSIIFLNCRKRKNRSSLHKHMQWQIHIHPEVQNIMEMRGMGSN